ncbi:hypothetical protein [Gorillibacterium sp. sgz5001074]|uniref:hypothetical protein n=1 Tax=Gorillibacterium sp. sgz5001074 TaxID=3446695 RepID=UPI003F67B13A
MQITSGSGQVSSSYYTDTSGSTAVRTATTADSTSSSGTTEESPAAIFEPSAPSPDMSFLYTKPMASAQTLAAESITAAEGDPPAGPQTIYDQWLADLESAFQDYSAAVNQAIDDFASVLTAEDKLAIHDGVENWFQSKRDELATLLTDTEETSKATLLQTADDELAARKSTFHDQVGARMEFAVWNETLAGQAVTMNKTISDAIRQSPEGVSTSDLEQWMDQLDTWAADMQQQLSDELEGFPADIQEAFVSEGELNTANLKLAILEQMRDTLTARNEAEAAAGEFHQSWLDSLDPLASGFLAEVNKKFYSLSSVSSQDLDQLGKNIDQWLNGLQGSYQTGLAGQIDASMVGVSLKFGELSADQLDSLRSTMWQSVTNLARQRNAYVDSGMVKAVDPKTVFSSGYNRATYEYGTGPSKVTMKLEKVSSSNRDTAWCYVVDANGQKRALSLSFANDSMTEKMREYLKETKVYGATLSLEKLNALMGKVRSTASSFEDINWDRLESKVNGSEEKSRLGDWIAQFAKLFVSMKA